MARLEATQTACTPQQMFEALGFAWVQAFETQPSRQSLSLLLCQWALETGWGKHMWCWNIGNFKSRDGDGRDWCFYKCDEVLPAGQAKQYLANAQIRADGTGPAVEYKYTTQKGDVCCWFWPDHPVSRFRAYQTLEAGADDYIRSLHHRFSQAWPAVLAGDPTQFIHQLKLLRYFTADEATYRATTVKLFDQFMAKDFDMSKIPVMSERERAQTFAQIALRLQDEVPDTERNS